jgi:phospholipase C
MAGKNKSPLDSFDHVVVLMLENRSFDNLLGYLYEDGVPSGKHFAGLQDGKFSNPIPKGAKGAEKKKVILTQASDHHQPFPDPGEEYQHINTQLFNHIDEANIAKPAIKMVAPFNLPSNPPAVPPMEGFVNDYINTFNAMENSDYHDPKYEQYKVIMQVFKPEQVPVISTLAKQFSVFDHWHCSVPTQTWSNRAFWHAATSGGFVINPTGEDDESCLENIVGMVQWVKEMWIKPTLFTRLKQKGISNTIYTHDVFSLTNLIHGLGSTTKFSSSIKSFYKDLQSDDFPKYSFIEPKFLGKHNDQHPSSVTHKTQAGTVLLGEKLIYDVYTAIKNSEKYRDKTLFIITHDEHGGCYDHVAPPTTVPPKPDMEGQNGFGFDRLGIRVPMVMISSYISKNTIINQEFDHTSFLHTMSEKWGFEHLTDRDKQASSFSGVFSEKLREWPDIPEPELPAGHDKVDYNSHPLNGLQQTILNSVAALKHDAKKLTGTLLGAEKQKVESIKTVGEAINYLEQNLIRPPIIKRHP